MLALPRQHAMAYQCLCTEHVLQGPRNDRYMPLCMFGFNSFVCLQVAMLTEKSVAPLLLGGGKGLGPPATLIGGFMVGNDQPPVTNHQPR